MIARPPFHNLAKVVLFFRAALMLLRVVVVVVVFSAEMTMSPLGVMTTSVVMTVAIDLMTVTATTDEMIGMAVVVAIAEMTEMATIGAMTGEMAGETIGNIVIAVTTGGIIGVMTEICNAVMEVAMVVAVVVGVVAHLLALLTPPARFAPSMGTLHVIVGGVILTVMMMRITLAMRREHMELIPTGIWTLVLQITSRDN
jgi:hypothetical protein